MTRSTDAALVPSDTGMSDAAPQVLVELLTSAGVSINGKRPWDIQVNDEDAYYQILSKGRLGFGEAFVDGLWESDQLDELLTRLLRHTVQDRLSGWSRVPLLKGLLHLPLFRSRSHHHAPYPARPHFDNGERLFEAMLDPSMSYSCGYWASALTLEQAQKHKLEMICKKLELKEGEWLLDIGCGWGGLAQYAAEHYGVAVTGITSSPAQLQSARKRCAGLPVNIELLDYHDLNGSFDKIVCIGMFEMERPARHPYFFERVSELLSDQGLFLLQTVGANAPLSVDPWFNKYIFPVRTIPTAKQLTRSIENRFMIDDWHCFGHDFDRTMMSWWENFEAAWPQLQEEFDERFYRMWKYYLHGCAAMFRSRRGHLWELVMSKPQRITPYRSPR